MITGLCHSGTWGSLGNFGGWGWAGLILNLVLWFGLIAGFALLVIWAVRRARVPVSTGPDDAGHRQTANRQTAIEILQAQFARGEITREQYELTKQTLG